MDWERGGMMQIESTREQMTAATPPIDPYLLEILVCPETKQRVVLADASLVEKLNRVREQGNLKSRDGQKVTDAFEAGLIREDRAYLYPIVDGIPKMLIESAIPLSDFGGN